MVGVLSPKSAYRVRDKLTRQASLRVLQTEAAREETGAPPIRDPAAEDGSWRGECVHHMCFQTLDPNRLLLQRARVGQGCSV